MHTWFLLIVGLSLWKKRTLSMNQSSVLVLTKCLKTQLNTYYYSMFAIKSVSFTPISVSLCLYGITVKRCTNRACWLSSPNKFQCSRCIQLVIPSITQHTPNRIWWCFWTERSLRCIFENLAAHIQIIWTFLFFWLFQIAFTEKCSWLQTLKQQQNTSNGNQFQC